MLCGGGRKVPLLIKLETFFLFFILLVCFIYLIIILFFIYLFIYFFLILFCFFLMCTTRNVVCVPLEHKNIPLKSIFQIGNIAWNARLRSYPGENTRSHPNSAVKHLWAGLVEWWVTTFESPVL